ncbi:hypothetical protein AG1IA_00175 [Rhizoctonia solani AG-1 IA]|uniref:BTB domain-containing protein n=1 Tax=Thanatephorus cucumeris (strain AG1-IA) TaxID=983506 RepID=L8X9S9_THACA|nr:hypothetical protein AG1IA_00175 [Rhizoctonia solani AG-1 IA]
MADILAPTVAEMTLTTSPLMMGTDMLPSSPSDAGDNALVSISTRFHMGERDMQDADIVLFSTDNVFFYSHRSTLLRESANQFGGVLMENDEMDEEVDVSKPMAGLDLTAPTPTLVVVPYPADVVNVILHLIYGFPVQRYQPPASVLRQVLPALVALGYNLHAFVTPHSELFLLLVQAAASNPLPMYTLAAQHSLEQLAVAISPFTLSGPLSDITDEMAQQMGPIYLKRLFCKFVLLFACSAPVLTRHNSVLHLGRTDALKRLLLPPPVPHPLTPGFECDVDAQKALARAWALACAYVVVEGRPDSLAASLIPLGAHLRCSLCRRSMEERVNSLLSGWNAVKCTI